MDPTMMLIDLLMPLVTVSEPCSDADIKDPKAGMRIVSTSPLTTCEETSDLHRCKQETTNCALATRRRWLRREENRHVIGLMFRAGLHALRFKGLQGFVSTALEYK